MTARPFREVFEHCPSCGARGVRAAPEPGPLTCATCGFLFFLNPATAVAALIENPEGRLLLIRRAKDPGRGLLGLPGGFIDPGERAEDAVAREVREEVGLETTACEFLASHPNEYEFRGVGYRVLDLFFRCRVRTWATLGALDEVDGTVLVARAEFDPAEIAFPSQRRAIEGAWAGAA